MSTADHRSLRRNQRVAEQCIEGTPLVTIGQEQGLVSPGPTIRMVDRALETALPQLDARAQRRLDGARLDRLLAAWWASATGGDADAAQLVLAILDQRARLRDGDHPEGASAT